MSVLQFFTLFLTVLLLHGVQLPLHYQKLTQPEILLHFFMFIQLVFFLIILAICLL